VKLLEVKTMLKKITLVRERVESWDKYPLSLPVIRCLDELSLHSRVCLFAGRERHGKIKPSRSYRGTLRVRPRGRQSQLPERQHGKQSLHRSVGARAAIVIRQADRGWVLFEG
jgi:predicted ATPase